MKKHLPFWIALLIGFIGFAQSSPSQSPSQRIITIKGKVLEQDSEIPLEYATLILQSTSDTSKVSGGITNENGVFEIETAPGVYNVIIEYISYNSYRSENVQLRADMDLGTIYLSANLEQLEEVEVVGEKTTVELRLDKKIYNVGSDMTVKGGSVTDVLDNVPSVSVDVEGNISLRGNESVRILINGKPAALSGIPTEALRQLPGDAIEKVEVITNPSARYDAEGTAGILNIVLKQSKTVGFNGSFTSTVGTPTNSRAGANLNLRMNKFNFFTNTSVNNDASPGNSNYFQQYFDNNGQTTSYQEEDRKTIRGGQGINANFGIEYLIDDKTSLTNSFVYRKSDGENTEDIAFKNFDGSFNPTLERDRNSVESDNRESKQYAINFMKRFDKDGHELKIDYRYSISENPEILTIEEVVQGTTTAVLPTEQQFNIGDDSSQLIQFDYVLPMGKENQSQFELGYRGNFLNQTTAYDFGQLNNGTFISNPELKNTLEYTENIQAAYTQFGTKFNKLSVLTGLRMEHTDIIIDLVETNDYTKKNYYSWFPSVFLGLDLNETDKLNLSYSRRLRRPRSWFINPFPSRSSNTNLFKGNPDLDPTFTNSFDLGYLSRINKVMLSSSIYYNISNKVFTFVTQETGEVVTIVNPDDPSNPVIVPVQLRQPINLADEERIGFELTASYSPKRNWRFSLNFNLYDRKTTGNFTYTNYFGEVITQNFDNENLEYFTRLSAKLLLPAKIDFQSNIMYRSPSRNAQGTSEGMLFTNLALSKDLFKDKSTLSLNVRDLFNSAKRVSETRTLNVLTQSTMQWRQRQINMTFTYRFNQNKNQGRRQRNFQSQDMQGEGMEFQGE
ncbi:MAG: TonB-dependent receptor [Flavobacteriaceae bacterium]|nr:TonB-dependent receptor [Flavobacteriaceae bacterium]NVJ72461.1 TonB-dependent receptor [Flavobacteriaceae bacterium]